MQDRLESEGVIRMVDLLAEQCRWSGDGEGQPAT